MLGNESETQTCMSQALNHKNESHVALVPFSEVIKDKKHRHKPQRLESTSSDAIRNLYLRLQLRVSWLLRGILQGRSLANPAQSTRRHLSRHPRPLPSLPRG